MRFISGFSTNAHTAYFVAKKPISIWWNGLFYKGKGKKKENIFLNDYYCHKFAIFGNRKCNENYFIFPTSAISCDTIDDVDIF